MNRIPLYLDLDLDLDLFRLWEEDDEARVRRSYICLGRLMGLTWTLCRGQRHRKHDFTNLVPRVFFILLEVAKRPWERACRFTCCGNPPQLPQVLFGCHRIKVIVPDVQTRRKSARKHCSSVIFFFDFPFSQCLSKMSRNVPTLFGMISRTLRSTCRVLLLPFLKRFQGLRALSLRRKSSRILHDYKCLRELSIFLCL